MNRIAYPNGRPVHSKTREPNVTELFGRLAEGFEQRWAPSARYARIQYGGKTIAYAFPRKGWVHLSLPEDATAAPTLAALIPDDALAAHPGNAKVRRGKPSGRVEVDVTEHTLEDGRKLLAWVAERVALKV